MSSKPWQGKQVVIVDDSQSVRDALRTAFEAVGMQVAGVAENGVVGLDLVKKLKPEIVSIDVIMPEMDGVELFRKIRAHDPGQKVVMISWLGAEAKILDNLKDTIPAHLFQKKPVSTEDLTKRLEYVYNPPLPVDKDAPKEEEIDSMADLGIKLVKAS